MRLNLTDATRAHPEPIGRLDLQESLQDVAGFPLEHTRYHWFFHSDVFVHLHLIFVIVGREADEHLV